MLTAKSAHPAVQHHPLWAGAERFVLDAAVGLMSRGHEVTVQSYPGTPLLQRARGAGL